MEAVKAICDIKGVVIANCFYNGETETRGMFWLMFFAKTFEQILFVERLILPGVLNSEGIIFNQDIYYPVCVVMDDGVFDKICDQVELKGKGKKDRNLVFSSDGNEINNIPFWD